MHRYLVLSISLVWLQYRVYLLVVRTVGQTKTVREKKIKQTAAAGWISRFLDGIIPVSYNYKNPHHLTYSNYTDTMHTGII